MIRLLFLFILIQLALIARYFVFGIFDVRIYATSFLALIAAVAVYMISKRFAQKELHYVPTTQAHWSFLMKQSSLLIARPIYYGQTLRGTSERFYKKKWHYYVYEMLDASFYIAIRLTIDGVIYEAIPKKATFFKLQSYWDIYENGVLIGTIQTVADLKNAAKLKEVLTIHYRDQQYETSAFTVQSAVQLCQDGATLATLSRSHLLSHIVVIDAKEDEPLHVLALIVHQVQFKNGS